MSSLNQMENGVEATAQSISFLNLVKCEVLKLKTLKSTYIAAIISAVLPLLFVALFVVSYKSQKDKPALPDNFIDDLTRLASWATTVTLIISILSVTSEFKNGTAAFYFVHLKRRDFWIWPKLVVLGIYGAILSVIAQIVMIAAAIPGLKSIDLSLNINSHFYAARIGTLFTAIFASIIGAAIAMIIRNQMAAVITALVYTLIIESTIASFLPKIGRFLIGRGNASIALVDQNQGNFSAPIGYLILVAWSALFLFAGIYRLNKTDFKSE